MSIDPFTYILSTLSVAGIIDVCHYFDDRYKDRTVEGGIFLQCFLMYSIIIGVSMGAICGSRFGIRFSMACGIRYGICSVM